MARPPLEGAIVLGVSLLLLTAIWLIVVLSMPASADTERFQQPDYRDSISWDVEVDGVSVSAVPRECGGDWCVDLAGSPPYCWTVTAYELGPVYYSWQTPKRLEAASTECVSLACRCDQNGNGAVGMWDVMKLLPSGVARAMACLGEIGAVC